MLFGINNSFIFKSYLKDTFICDEIINFFNENTTEKSEGKIGLGVDKSTKDSTDSAIHLSNDSISWVKKYREELIHILREYEKKYFNVTDLGYWGISEQSNIQYYKPNCGFTRFHCERTCYENSERHLVFMTYLNDIKNGGETEFYHQKIKVKPRKGKTLIWPADWTHTHRGIVAPKEEKYIVTGWLSFILDEQINNNY